jgi:hypothetical protein
MIRRIPGAILFFFAELRHPKVLILDHNQAQYVESLFLGCANPEDIGRAMDKTYKRTSFRYFQEPNSAMTGFIFGTGDYEIEGLEYMRSAMIELGAMTPKKDGDYYDTDHPMVRRIANIATTATVPQSRRG